MCSLKHNFLNGNIKHREMSNLFSGDHPNTSIVIELDHVLSLLLLLFVDSQPKSTDEINLMQLTENFTDLPQRNQARNKFV